MICKKVDLARLWQPVPDVIILHGLGSAFHPYLRGLGAFR